MGISVKERLEREKLEQEIRKLTADADLAEFNLATAQRARLDEEASEDEQRIYTFSDEVTKESVEDCIASVSHWARREPAPITVVFNSPGGTVQHGFALYDCLRLMSVRGNPITTVGMGWTASMGGILMQAGDWRILSSNAYFLIHEVSSGTWGKVSDMNDDVDWNKRLWDRCSAILARRSKLTARQIQRRAHRTDWWLDAKEALALGFIDEIQ